jgi:hypothetical protein
LRSDPYARARGLYTVPAGKHWLEPAEPDHRERQTVVSAHARPMAVSLRFLLPARAEGYRFEAAGAQVALADVGEGSYFVHLTVPGGAGPRRTTVTASPATGNRPPVIAFAVDGRAALPGRPIEVAVGRPVEIGAGATADPDANDGVLALEWTLPDGASARGRSVVFAPERAGDYRVTLEAIDRHGAPARAELALHASGAVLPEIAPPHGCGCQIGARPARIGAALVILALVLLWRWRSRVCYSGRGMRGGVSAL